MLITATVSEVELDGDYGPIESVAATCSRCGHCTESYGTQERSIKRCLALLREECPRNENDFYVTPKEKELER
jgi:hypothetical protein